MKKKTFKLPKLIFVFCLLFFLLAGSFVFALKSTAISDNIKQVVETILNSSETGSLNPLGVSENNQKVQTQKTSNTTLTSICLVVISISGVGIIFILLRPLFRRRRKKFLIKF